METMKPSIEELEAHIGVVKCGSVTAAAKQLRTTKSVVSKRLQSLEYKLGGSLFHRTGRSMIATDTGSEVYDMAVKLISDMNQLVDNVVSRSGKLQGTVRMSAPVSFGNLYINPLIADFMAIHPNIKVTLDLDDRFIDLRAGNYDFSIRIGRLKDSGLKARKMANSKRGIFCSPDYAATRGKPESLEQLADHDCLGYANATSGHIWKFESLNGTKTQALSLSARLLSNSGEALKAAAMRGVGIAALPHFMICNELRNGSLKEIVFPQWRLMSDSVYALYPDSIALSNKARTLIDFIISHMQPSEPWAI